MATDPFDIAATSAQLQQRQQTQRLMALRQADDCAAAGGHSKIMTASNTEVAAPEQAVSPAAVNTCPEATVAMPTAGSAVSKGLFRQNALKTVNYCLLFSLVGMSDSSIGAALPGLTCLAKTSEQRATLLLFFHEIAVLLTTLAAGFLSRKVPANPVLCAISALVPASFIMVTMCRSLPTMALIFSLMGLLEGCLEFFCNTQMIFLYRADSGPFLQAMFFCQSLGAFVAPLVIGAFMSQPLGRQWENCSLPQELEVAVANPLGAAGQALAAGTEDPGLEDTLARVRYPYYAIAVIQVPIMISMFYLTYKEGWRQDSSNSGSAVEDDTQNLREEGSSAYLVLVLASLCAFALDGILGSYSSLIYSFSLDSVSAVEDKARTAYLSATFWGFTLLGRLSGIFLTMRISAVHLVFIDLAGLLISSTLFMIGQKSVPILFLSTVMTGFFISHCMPALLALSEQFVQVTRDRATALVASAAFGEAVIPVAMAAVIRKIRPTAYPVFHALFVLLSGVLCFLFVSLGYRTRKSQQREGIGGGSFTNFLLFGVFSNLTAMKLKNGGSGGGDHLTAQQRSVTVQQRGRRQFRHEEEEEEEDGEGFDELARRRQHGNS